MIEELIKSIVGGTDLRVTFQSSVDPDADFVCAYIWAPELESPRGAGGHRSPECALAIAAARGLGSLYRRVRLGYISLEEILKSGEEG